MRFTRALSVAIVAMFAFAAFAAVAGNTASSDGADSTDYSVGIYASYSGLSQKDATSLDDVNDFVRYRCNEITTVLFDNDIYYSSFVDIVYSYDKVDESVSKYEKRVGNTFTYGDAAKVTISDIKVTITAKKSVDLFVDSYDRYNDNSFEKSSEVASYVGVTTLDAGKTIVIKMEKLTYEKSSIYEHTYAAVPGTDKYIRTGVKDYYNELLEAKADVEINGRTITFNVDNDESYIENSENSYNNDQYKDKDLYNQKFGYDINTCNDFTKITADGKDYCYEKNITAAQAEVYDSCYLCEIDSSDDYEPLPDKTEFDYRDIMSNVSSDNNVAKKAIEDLGGKCSMDFSDAESLAKDVADDCNVSSPNNETFNWAIIIAIVVILVIIAILVAVKAGVFKK